MSKVLNLNDPKTLDEVKQGAYTTKFDLEQHFNVYLGEIKREQFFNDKLNIKIICDNGEYAISSSEAHLRTYNNVDLQILKSVYEHLDLKANNTSNPNTIKSNLIFIAAVLLIVILVYYFFK